MDEYGGHEVEFLDCIPDRYKCTVCTRVFKDPELTVCCGQHYCSTCLQKWFKENKKNCPHCRTEGSKFQHVENKSLKSEINELNIYCSNKAQGCSWTGKLGGLREHLTHSGGNACDYGEIDCPNNCGIKVIRNNLASHIITTCSHRQDNCQYCSKQDTLAALSEHKNVCPKFPLACPNNCDSLPMHREKMSEHLQICPKRKQACPFEEHGCTSVQLKPGELDKHMETHAIQHMHMIAKTNKAMREEIETTKNQLKRVCDEQTEEKSSVKKLKQSLIFELRGLDGSVHDGMKSSAYEAIETILDDENDIMSKVEPTTFRLLDFKKLAESHTIWYSGPFKIQHYKLCLAIQPRGIGTGLDSHASLSLILLEVGTLKEENRTFESLLSVVHVLVPIFKLGEGKHHRVYLSSVCGSNLDLTPLKEGEEKRILGTCEEWIEHEIVAKCLWQDSLIVKVEHAKEEGSSMRDLHAAMLRHAMGAGNPSECRQS